MPGVAAVAVAMAGLASAADAPVSGSDEASSCNDGCVGGCAA